MVHVSFTININSFFFIKIDYKPLTPFMWMLHMKFDVDWPSGSQRCLAICHKHLFSQEAGISTSVILIFYRKHKHIAYSYLYVKVVLLINEHGGLVGCLVGRLGWPC